MFVAQLSALDLGAWVEIRAVAKGSKYTKRYAGFITEVKHGTNEGCTTLRLSYAYRPEDRSKESVELSIKTRGGTAFSFPYGAEILEHVEPKV